MSIQDPDKPIYYVYAWYFKDTNEIFHIGKGKNSRYKETSAHRNKFFVNVIHKHKDNVDVKFIATCLTNREALAKERELIAYYKSIGQCKTNLHEGGCGGNTGNYDSIERSRKLSIAGKKRTGQRNPMFGRHHTAQTKAKISNANKGRRLTSEHIEKLRKANTGRVKSQEERLKLSIANRNKCVSKTSIVKGIKTQARNVYELSYSGKVFAVCISYSALAKLCKKHLGISTTILSKICNKAFFPKFNRHKWISRLGIAEIRKDDYAHLAEHFTDSPLCILDDQLFSVVQHIVKTMKDNADITRYGTTNPSTRK